MKSAELRDKMVARVKAAHKQHPNFEDLPVLKNVTASARHAEIAQPINNSTYVEALHSLFSVDPDKTEIAGRHGTRLIAK